jgi:predicted O-linked N-acetylglucosamine transferase (SPINDLY family)
LELKEYYINLFVNKLVNKNQLIFTEQVSRFKLLEMYNEIDIALDPFPYNGGTTNFEAAWMCVPILTKEGDTFLSRCGFSINFNLGLSEMVYKNEDECINKIKIFNNDYKKLQLIKDKLIKNKKLHSLFDTKKFANDLSEQLYGLIKKDKEKLDFY